MINLRDDEHWTNENHKQRMTSKEWRNLLLDKEDGMIFRGHLRRLVAKSLGAGVVEVSKAILDGKGKTND